MNGSNLKLVAGGRGAAREAAVLHPVGSERCDDDAADESATFADLEASPVLLADMFREEFRRGGAGRAELTCAQIGRHFGAACVLAFGMAPARRFGRALIEGIKGAVPGI